MPFGTSPYPTFTNSSWRYTANRIACPITPLFPSRLIVNRTKQAIQTKNGGLWRHPSLGDTPFGASARLASTTGFSIRTRYLVIHPPKEVYNLPRGQRAPHEGRPPCSSPSSRPFLQPSWPPPSIPAKKLVRCKSERTFVVRRADVDSTHHSLMGG